MSIANVVASEDNHLRSSLSVKLKYTWKNMQQYCYL